jgi:CRISPR-associated endonuclease/helicase Cas3
VTAADFGRFYSAIHGHDPFPWQERLLQQVLFDGWPQTITLPTSSGKTSVIDVAVFHLALEAGKSALQRKAPLRVFFVIDRRVVVDEAAEHALKLARGLLDNSEEIIESVANALRKFDARYPLDVAVMRGGVCLDSTWADEPNQPLVCVSTVDQVGSRLLFRGYQVTEEARPVHAGLVGNDSLIIVDEAHLSRAFLDTLGEVEKMQKSGLTQSQPARGIAVLKMSATIRQEGTRFQLNEADYENRVLRKRLEASKPTELRSPAKGFEEELVRAAKELAMMPDVYVVGVVVNTVATARAIFEGLRKSKMGEAILITGRNRPYHSKKLWEEYKDRIAANPNRATKERLFVVATQTVEVGANLDFDALVTEAAPLDALRQRFGRLNRLGNRPKAQAVIVLRPKGDVVYGKATANTWELLNRLETVDFGVRAINEAMENQDLDGVNTTSARGPLIFSKYFEMWAQTNPTPSPDAVVAPFLHGPDALDDSDVQIIWREDLPEDGDPQAWQAAVELAPPVSTEALALPLGALRR